MTKSSKNVARGTGYPCSCNGSNLVSRGLTELGCNNNIPVVAALHPAEVGYNVQTQGEQQQQQVSGMIRWNEVQSHTS